MLSEGDFAPDFTLTTDADVPLTLSDLRGRSVLLYFYPKDDTPGCTTEACEFRDAFPRFEVLGAEVLGVSPDTPKSHRKFKEKYDLPFTLLADTHHEVAEAYGVWQEKSMFGRTFWGVVRTTFLVDPDGRIARIFEEVKPEGHAAEVADALASLKY